MDGVDADGRRFLEELGIKDDFDLAGHWYCEQSVLEDTQNPTIVSAWLQAQRRKMDSKCDVGTIKAIFDVCDVNGDGKISVEEFTAFMRLLDPAITDDAIDQIIDFSSRGCVSEGSLIFSEFLDWVWDTEDGAHTVKQVVTKGTSVGTEESFPVKISFLSGDILEVADVSPCDTLHTLYLKVEASTQLPKSKFRLAEGVNAYTPADLVKSVHELGITADSQLALVRRAVLDVKKDMAVEVSGAGITEVNGCYHSKQVDYGEIGCYGFETKSFFMYYSRYENPGWYIVDDVDAGIYWNPEQDPWVLPLDGWEVAKSSSGEINPAAEPAPVVALATSSEKPVAVEKSDEGD